MLLFNFFGRCNLEIGLKVIAPYGRILIVGSTGSLEINPRLAMIKEVDILALALWKALPEEYNENLHAVEAFLESGILYPEVGKRMLIKHMIKL